MNKHFYRIVFNKVRGMLMVVSEISGSHQGEGRVHSATHIKPQPNVIVSLTKVAFLTSIALGSLTFVHSSYANNIVTDANANKSQRPTTIDTANGATQVNIQSANQNGVSHNKYTQFDVSQKGVILNNSSQLSKTELAGYVKGNDFLIKSGSAKIILNEVNSKNASQLNGYIEVAGQKAQVIIANPAGITCNGCGFINADKATLTTGKPVMENGKLTGYRVEQGKITVTGKGLDSSKQSYTELIARSVDVNSSIWGGDVTVVTGRNNVSHDLKSINNLGSDANKPELAVDVSSLGGMYAGKIKMVGTESGVGVHNAGNLGASSGKISISADGKIVNTGSIQAKQDITLSSNQSINNHKTIYSKANVNLKSQASINNEGTIVAQNSVTIKAANSVKNKSGATLAAGVDEKGNLTQQGDLTITASDASLNGQQLATNHLSVTTNSKLDLSQSQNKAGSLSLKSAQLDSQNATIATEGDATISASEWHNQQSKIHVKGDLFATATTIANTDAALYANRLTLTADSLSGDGKLYADSSLTLTLKASFINDNEVLSNGDLSIYSDNLIQNEGKMLANDSLTLKGKNLINESTGVIAANKALSVNVNELIQNTGVIQSAKRLELTASDIINNENAEIEADTFNLNATNLTNKGLLNGGDITLRLAGELNNFDGGRIYGDNLSVQANTLNNEASGDTAPVIAAREQLTLTATTVNNRNHAILLSLGDLNIDATTINNHSSKIQSSGNMTLNVDTLNNINDRIETEEVLVSTEHIVEYSPLGSSTRYTPDKVKLEISPKKRHNYLLLKSLDGSFGDAKKFIKYDYDVNHYETQVTISDAAEIIAGKNLTINAHHIQNENSYILAGNQLTIESITLNNISLQGTEKAISLGQAITYKPKDAGHSGIGMKKKYGQSKKSTPYSNSIIKDIDLATAKIEDHQVINAANISLTERNDSAVRINSISLIEPNTSLPNNSLYIINKGVEKNYLVETDLRFTNKKKWLSSDYMFEQLRTDPNSIQKRLGDGYYEQQLIREQITSLTGGYYLKGYSSDLDQYKALMTAGVTFSQQYGLSIGVALTPEQMQALTTDIVWMVSKTVQVDGENVDMLVPQVYVVNRPQVTTTGALLAGQGVSIKASDDIDSSGTVFSKNDLSIFGQNVNNQGTIMGGSLDIKALNDINSQGALIGDNGVSLAANHNINLSSTTSTTNTQYGKNSTSNTVIGSVSSVQTKNGDITIQAGNDVNLNAAFIVNQSEEGQTTLSAGNDINLATVKTSAQEKTIWDKSNYRITDKEEAVGSEIMANGNVTLKANNDVNIKASTISTDNTLTLKAGNDINITSDSERDQLTDHQKTSSKGFMSKSSETTHIEVDNQTQTGSRFSAGAVVMNAGNDVSITGSQVVGTQDVTIAAQNDVNINAAEESYYRFEQTIKTKSGLMRSGGLGVTIGSEKENLKQTNTTQDYAGSTVGSTQGNVTITAGKDLSVEGSDVIAQQDITMKGENVNIIANDSTTVYKEEYKYEKTGLTIAVTGTAANVYDAAKAVEQAKKRDNDQLLALQSIKAALTAIQAIEDLQLKNQKGETQASIGVSVMYGTQKTERTVNQEQHNVVSSGVSAGHNITITATGNGDNKSSGDITLRGSEVRAGNDITLDAARDLNVIAAVNTQHSDRDEKSYGGGVGVQAQYGGDESGIRFKGNANYSRERERADGSTWSESIISAGNKLNVTTGNNTNIIGGQLEGDTVKMDVGNNLNIQSLQDSDDYDYEKISGSVSGTAGWGGASANGSFSSTDIESKWRSVTDQSGIFAGKGGFDITVGNNTDLKGAVIASEADDNTKNRLDTGTISFSDIKNKADYSVDYVSVSVGTSGTSPTGGAPTVYHNSGSDSSITHSAVENGLIIVRDKDKQQQDINTLSRDTENANNSLGQIFDKQKELDKIESVELVKDIAAQAKDILKKYDRIQAQNEVNENREELAKREAQKVYDKLSDEEKAAYTLEQFYEANKDGWYYAAVDEQVKVNLKKDKNLGTMGGNVSKGIDAATSIVTGFITGDITGGLAGASAPYLATLIKESTYAKDANGHYIYENGEKKVDTAANLIAHAILGAVVAELQGNSGLAGGMGAVTGEVAAQFIAKNLYGKELKDLTEAEKENISALSQLASGLAVASVGGSTSDVGAAIASSKNAVENNYLSLNEAAREKYLLAQEKNGKLTEAEQKELKSIQDKDRISDERLVAACENSGSAACLHEQKLAHKAKDSYAGYAEYNAYYNLQEQFPEQMAKYGDLIGDYTKEVIKLVEQGHTVDSAKAYIDNQIAKDKAYAEKYQEAMDSLPSWAKTWMIIADTVNSVYGAKQAGVSLKQLNNQGLTNAGKGTTGTNVVAQGKSGLVGSKTIQPNTTVKLTESTKLPNGEVIPKGSTVTVSDNTMKITYPDGTSKISNYNKAMSSPELNAGKGTSTVKGNDILPNYKVSDLSKIDDKALNVSKIRNSLTEYVKKGDVDGISVATGSITVNGQTEYVLAVSGKSWKGNAPTSINIDGINYKVILEDSQSIRNYPSSATQTNYNHAEHKLFSYMKDNYSGQKADVKISVENTSIDKPGMCNGCNGSGVKFAEEMGENFNINMYQGTTGKNR